MELNQKKFQLMQFGKDETLKEPYMISNDVMLHRETDIKDLGVYISDDLSWRTQMTEAVKTGRKYMGWILRSFTSRSPEVIIHLYQAYVIPRLEYASILWSPYLIRDIVQLESIQRTITAKIEGCENLNYHQRLHKLKLYSMQRRRERFQAIYMYKIANSLVPNNLNFQFYTTTRYGTKCRYPKMCATHSHLSTVHQHFFTSTGPAIFNIIPGKIKEAKSLDIFKSHLDKYLRTIPDLPPTPGYPSLNRNTVLEWATGGCNLTDVIFTLAVQGQREMGAAVNPDRS